MLLQFSVENFASIKNEVVLSAIAGNGSEHSDSLCVTAQGENVLPALAIYGANAAGKTNINKAITAAIIILRYSNIRQVNDPIPQIIPFAFDEVSKSIPSSFDFIFAVNGHKYEYGFSADSTKIYTEYLYEFKTVRKSKIFERSDCSTFVFPKALEKELRQYVSKNADNKLFLATATEWNCNITREAFLWFANDIDSYNEESFNIDTLNPGILNAFANDINGKLKQFEKEMMRVTDMSISDYELEIENKKISDPNIIQSIVPAAMGVNEMVRTRLSIETKHRVTQNELNKEYTLPFKLESNGTLKLFFFNPVIKDALEKGKTIVIDEIDSSFHPAVLRYLIGIFMDRRTNPNGAQLIFNTHDVSLLSLDVFRRDQIYFVEKDNDTGISDLYSLDEFSPRKSADVRKGYLQGRYGAVPYIDFGGLKWD